MWLRRQIKCSFFAYHLANTEPQKLLPICVVEVQGFYSVLNSLELTREVLAIKHEVILPGLRKYILTNCFKWGLTGVYQLCIITSFSFTGK